MLSALPVRAPSLTHTHMPRKGHERGCLAGCFLLPPHFNVTKPSCCFQHTALGRRQREAADELPEAPWGAKGRGRVRQHEGDFPQIQPAFSTAGISRGSCRAPTHPASSFLLLYNLLSQEMDTFLLPSYPSECFPSIPFSICGRCSPWLCFFSSQKLVIHREVTCY